MAHSSGARGAGWLAGLVAVTGLGTYALASIPGAGTPSAGLPYVGTLEKDGVGLTGSADFIVSVYDATAAVTPIYQEQHTGVTVLGGQFTLLVGTGATLSGSMTALQSATTRELFIGLQVQAAGDVAFVSLAGRQRLGSSGYAWRGAPGQDFAVDGALSVGSILTRGGGIIAQGSDGNGRWIKLETGLMLCMQQVTGYSATLTKGSNASSSFEPYYTPFTWTLPAGCTFTTILSKHFTAALSTSNYPVWGGYHSRSDNLGSLHFSIVSNYPYNTTFDLTMLAVGLWQ